MPETQPYTPLPHNPSEASDPDKQYSRSTEAQEIIQQKSGFLETWALWVFLCILLLIVAGTQFIRYPDTIQAKARLSSLNGPKDIVPFQSGRITNLFARNGSSVRQGEAIAYIESPADTREILTLSRQVKEAIDLLAKDQLEKMSAIFSRHFENLGDVQPAYQTFIAALQQFDDYYVNGYYRKKKSLLQKDLSAISEMNETLKDQLTLMEKDYQLSQEAFEMNKKLYDQKVISQEEYREQQSKLLNKQLLFPQVNSNVLANQNQQRDKIKDLEQLDHDLLQQKTTVEQALETLKSALAIWVQKYIISSPVDGTLYLTRPLQPNQYIQQGRNIAYVAPSDNRLFVELYLPQTNLGKVAPGMKVQLRFDAYPYQEHGTVPGVIDYISNVVSDSGYLATIKLTNGLTTSQHHQLQFKDGLKADALIITKDMSLFKRFYYNILKGASL